LKGVDRGGGGKKGRVSFSRSVYSKEIKGFKSRLGNYRHFSGGIMVINFLNIGGKKKEKEKKG